MSNGYEEKTDDKGKNRDRIIGHGTINRFGERLKVAMKGMSNAELARRSGMSETTIRKYLQGKIYPALDSLAIVADACGVSLTWLATGEQEQKAGDTIVRDESKQKFDMDIEVLTHLLNRLKKEERELVFNFISREGVNNLVRLAAMNTSTISPDAVESIIDALPLRPVLKSAIKIGMAGSEDTDQEILRFIERHDASDNATQQSGVVSDGRKKSAS
ncbi:helix-turn-helix domain-containing protein [Salmonella enterica]|uniref:Helix-turn-helix domain-containing protein n=1 Tax=Salmonella enterica TaxID=28901 RepID=A0A744NMC7_SALER|nr:helix-turn-helix domain-containing protein [Salmonella enterica]EBQ0712616.1 helix-turn-helix domain-containing protein [Salmonella enterica subsp. enterica]ECT9311609.1 helix-turn-helix domain-containing protein [Salmonella enterica subsp. enterica serovar Montevideo]EDQ4910928.1 helix-turn-helix domain-containing protein [Salmonella enterica subsp. enterica serovar Gaminara]EAS1931733.1 helix-turn-helix domain-containing protein [Salmonella enterica]